MSGTTGRPEGGDRARAERAGCSPSEAPLRLERYVGWNLNTGCEVQRKGMEAEGEGAEGKERASRSVQAPLTPSGLCRQSQAHGKHVYFPSPPHSRLCRRDWSELWVQRSRPGGPSPLPPGRAMAKGQGMGTTDDTRDPCLRREEEPLGTRCSRRGVSDPGPSPATV